MCVCIRICQLLVHLKLALPLCLAYFIALCWRFPLCLFLCWAYKKFNSKSCPALLISGLYMHNTNPLWPLYIRIFFLRADFCTRVNSACVWSRENVCKESEKCKLKCSCWKCGCLLFWPPAAADAAAATVRMASSGSCGCLASSAFSSSPSYPGMWDVAWWPRGIQLSGQFSADCQMHGGGLKLCRRSTLARSEFRLHLLLKRCKTEQFP